MVEVPHGPCTSLEKCGKKVSKRFFREVCLAEIGKGAWAVCKRYGWNEEHQKPSEWAAEARQ